MIYPEMWKKFKKEAARRGYVIKMEGDNAFRKIRKPESYFKMLPSSDGETISVFEAGIGKFNLA